MCYCPFPAAKKKHLSSYHAKQKSCKEGGRECKGEREREKRHTTQKIVIIIFYHHLSLPHRRRLLLLLCAFLLLEFTVREARGETEKNMKTRRHLKKGKNANVCAAQFMRFLHNNKRAEI